MSDMNDFYKRIENVRRILVQTTLEPLQGNRFQPTGFPDLGAAEYAIPDGTEMLLVESAQSMANRMESVCWDEGNNDLIGSLKGLPYISVDLGEGAFTSSVTEAHRINSEYVLFKGSKARELLEKGVGLDGKKDKPIDFKKLYQTLLKYDVNSLVHGTFIEEVDGRLRLPRAISGFIEAKGVTRVQSGGVKFSHVNPSLKDGKGNVPYSRIEYAADEITAYFNLDVSQIRGYSLDDSATNLLLVLALYKMQKCLKEDLRLRTACDLKVAEGFDVTDENGKSIEIPEFDVVEKELASLIQTCSDGELFAVPPVTAIKYVAGKTGKQNSDSK